MDGLCSQFSVLNKCEKNLQFVFLVNHKHLLVSTIFEPLLIKFVQKGMKSLQQVHGFDTSMMMTMHFYGSILCAVYF